MPVGFPTKVNYATGDVLSATNMNDLSGTVNLLESAAESAAGVNKIINGDFGIWQRGTSFSTNATYNADRWTAGWDSSPTVTISRQTFTPGTAPVAGYEGQFFQRTLVSAASSMTLLDQKQYIEDVRTFAGQTVTVSFWAKADAARAIKIFLGQNFGSGGSTQVDTAQTTINATTSWARYSTTITLASVSGKTIGTSSYLALYLRYPGSTFTIDIWGVQVEQSSTASDFKTATGTIQGELAACQRYYYAADASVIWLGNVTSGNNYYGTFYYPIAMRIAPTITTTVTSAGNFPTSNPSTTSIGKFSFWAFLGSSATGVGNFQFTYTASAEL